MKIVTVIQSRMNSRRLPGKALLDLRGTSALQRVLERIKPSKYVQEIYLATTADPSDDILEQWAAKNGIKCYRGSTTDVLSSYYQIIKKTGADGVVRITGDCPLIDYEIIDKVFEAFLAGDCDCATNTTPPTFPDGLDVEIFSSKAIEKSQQEAKSDFEKEHINVYIYQNPGIFKIKNVTNEENLSAYRLTLDTPEDKKLLESLIGECEKSGKYCHLKEIAEILKNNPSWSDINAKHERNQGYKIGY
ncbi:MAG: glycosyltransferase family protein [Candidatus Pacebacteria bacterium]|nr:glycosyltransferase family protein [Candidatus Paceibacterota bacterium]